MIRNKMNYSAITFAIMAMGVFAGSANAAVATSNVPINMSVAAASCTVSNSSTSIVLNPATSPAMTTQTYMTTNGFTVASAVTSFYASTNSALNQTATILCSVASTPILSINVTPGTSAKMAGSYTGNQLLVDQAATPGVAGGVNNNGGFQWSSDLVSINGTALASTYAFSVSGMTQAYTTQFSTGSTMSGGYSTGSFVWRPVAYAGNASTAIGNPTGGTYSGSYQIVVNY